MSNKAIKILIKYIKKHNCVCITSKGQLLFLKDTFNISKKEIEELKKIGL